MNTFFSNTIGFFSFLCITLACYSMQPEVHNACISHIDKSISYAPKKIRQDLAVMGIPCHLDDIVMPVLINIFDGEKENSPNEWPVVYLPVRHFYNPEYNTVSLTLNNIPFSLCLIGNPETETSFQEELKSRLRLFKTYPMPAAWSDTKSFVFLPEQEHIKQNIIAAGYDNKGFPRYVHGSNGFVGMKELIEKYGSLSSTVAPELSQSRLTGQSSEPISTPKLSQSIIAQLSKSFTKKSSKKTHIKPYQSRTK